MTVQPVPRCALLPLLLLLGCPIRPSSHQQPVPQQPPPPATRTLAPFVPAPRGGAGLPDLPAPPLRVVDAAPRGRTDGTAAIRLRFNQPVAALGADPPASGLLAIEPALAGRASWQEPDLMVFDAEQPAQATAYTVRLRVPLVALSGARLEPVDGPVLTFETPRPRITEAFPSPDPDSLLQQRRLDAGLLIQFDQPVPLEQVRRHLSARATGSSRPIPVVVRNTTEAHLLRLGLDSGGWPVRAQGLLFTILPQERWPLGSEITVSLEPGVRGRAGPLPGDTRWQDRFHTHGPLRVERPPCAPLVGCGLRPITLRLTNPIAEQQLRRVRVTPTPDQLWLDLLDDWRDGEGGREITVHGSFLPGTTYQVRLPADLTDVYGQRLDQDLVFAAPIERRPQVALSQSAGTLEATGTRTIGVLTRHVRALAVRAAVLSDQELAALVLPEPGAQDQEQGERQQARLDRYPFPWQQAPMRVIERRYPLRPRGPTEWDSIALELGELGGGQRRPILIEARATELVPGLAGQPFPPPARGLFRVTDLGPVAVLSGPRSVAAVLHLSTGAPAAGVTVRQHLLGDTAGKLVGSTDAQGLVSVPGLAAWQRGQTPSLFSFTLGEDRAYLPVGPASALWSPPPPRPGLRPGEALLTRLVTERGLYRPGERVRVVGWAAVDSPYVRSGLRRIPAEQQVQFVLRDPREQAVVAATARTTAEGKFWAELPLPQRPRLGRYAVAATLAGETIEAQVRVEEVRVPAFAVRASLDRQDVLPGEAARVLVSASYYFGGPVPIQRGTWAQSCRPEDYEVPGLGPKWIAGMTPLALRWQERRGPAVSLEGGGAGRLELRADPALVLPGAPNLCRVRVTVTDGSEQWLSADAGFRVHPARSYLALRPPRGARVGELAMVSARAVTPAGARVAAAGVQIEIERRWSEPIFKIVEGVRLRVGDAPRHEPVRRCILELQAAGPEPPCGFTPALAGQYVVRAAGRAPGQLAPIEAMFFVAERLPRASPQPPAGLELHLSREEVEPGDSLKVVVRGPWQDGSGLLMLWRNGLREQHPFVLRGGEASLSLTVDDTWTPVVSLTALVVHRDARGLQAVHQTCAAVRQSRAHRHLQVAVEAPAQAAPGGKVPVVVRVRGADGNPVRAQVALWAVDEALLALTRHRVPDLGLDFLPGTGASPTEVDDYGSLLLPYMPQEVDPWLLKPALGRLRSRRGVAPDVIPGSAEVRGGVRARFEGTPLFLADLATGPDGIVRAEAALPDNLSTFRITAVASARLIDGESPGRFGTGDTLLTVTGPLVLRASLPRLLRPGDGAEIAALVNNLDGPAGTVRVGIALIQPAGAPSLALASAAVQAAPIAAGALLRLPFEITAARPGVTEIELSAALTPAGGGPVLRDALRLPLPVEVEPAQRARAAVYGTLTDGAAVAVPVALPADALPGRGALTVSASATLLGGLGEAARALIDYPYGCAEQTASRLLPLAVLTDLGALGVAVPDGAAFVRAGVERLAGMQLESGGFAYWPGGREPNVYASAYAAWVLELLRRAGHPVPAALLASARGFLAQVVAREDWRPDDVLEGSRRALALHVLGEIGVAGEPALGRLFEGRGGLPAFARAFLLMALHRRAPGDPRVRVVLGELLGSVAEVPGAAHVVEWAGWRLDSLFHSDARGDAIVLLALLQVQPDHALVPKLARGLLERRGDGAWRNTQENAYALLALAAYARAYEREAPSLMARAWAGQRQVLGVRMQGHGGSERVVTLPLDEAVALGRFTGSGGLLPVVLQRQGQGRLYYRLGLEWVPRDQDRAAQEHGLAIERRLRTAAGPVQGPIRPGELVALDVELRARTLLSYVVLDVPLPPGLEVVQKELGGNREVQYRPEEAQKEEPQLDGMRGRWLSHFEGRRDRVLIFVDTLQPGTHGHTVELRATVPGRYAMPAAVAAAMYAPEVYGRSAAAQITVR